MKPPPLFLAFTGAVFLVGALLLPQHSHGDGIPGVEPALAQLFTEVAAQQAAITANQAKIDEQLGAIAEDVRVARIFVSRGGGKVKQP